MLTWGLIATGLALVALLGNVWLILKHYRVLGSLRDLNRNVAEIGSKVDDSHPRGADPRMDPNIGG